MYVQYKLIQLYKRPNTSNVKFCLYESEDIRRPLWLKELSVKILFLFNNLKNDVTLCASYIF